MKVGLAPEWFEPPDGERLCDRVLEDADEAGIAALLRHVDADDVRLRFFVSVRVFDHRFLWPLVHYDHGHGVAVVAVNPQTGDFSGVGRLHCDFGLSDGEFALLVRSDHHRHGLGAHLLTRLLDWARDQGVKRVFGEVLRENTPMLALCRHLGFAVRAAAEDPSVMCVTIDPRRATARVAATPPMPSLTRP